MFLYTLISYAGRISYTINKRIRIGSEAWNLKKLKQSKQMNWDLRNYQILTVFLSPCTDTVEHPREWIQRRIESIVLHVLIASEISIVSFLSQFCFLPYNFQMYNYVWVSVSWANKTRKGPIRRLRILSVREFVKIRKLIYKRRKNVDRSYKVVMGKTPWTKKDWFNQSIK